MTCLRFVLMVIACVGMSLGIAFAQDDAMKGGTVRGQITDVTPAQNPIEGVEVKIVAQNGGKEFITKTDAKGEYEHTGLPAGRYLISISKDGYDDRVGKPVTVVERGDHFVPLKTAQKGNIERFFEVQPVQQGKMDMVIKQRIKQQIGSLLQGMAESMGERYNLDEAVVKSLYQSMLNSIDGMLAQVGGLSTFARVNVPLLKMLLSQPDCKAAFTKHLSEAQLQDYLDFTEARQQRDQQAVARRLTMLIDKELSLTADQREKIAKLLRGAALNEGFPISMSTLRISSHQAIHLVPYRLKISLDGILSEAQSKVWQGLINTNANRERFIVNLAKAKVKDGVEDEKVDEGEIADPTKKRAFIRKKGVEPVKIEKKVEIVIDEIMVDPRRMLPWIELNADTAKSQEQMMEITEAKLVAHTELLGPLDERAARRLALVTKGVAQQYTEARGETREAMNELWGDERTKVDITDHPLYQQTIKDVLSEEAFAEYSEYRAERETFHQQALRDLVVACMDTQLLLDDTQRETLETAASQLVPGPLKEEKPAEFMFFRLFPQTVNFEILTPWQQGEFERMFGPLAF